MNVCDVFAVAIKEREAFQQPQKCAGVKRHKGRKPDWCFTEAKPPTGGAAYTVLLCAGCLYTILLYNVPPIFIRFYPFASVPTATAVIAAKTSRLLILSTLTNNFRSMPPGVFQTIYPVGFFSMVIIKP